MSTTSATTVQARVRALPLPIFRSNIAASWRSLLAWTVFMVSAVLLILRLYPTVTTPAMLAAINRMPAFLYGALRFDQIHTGPGYTQALIFSLVGWIILIAAGIRWGSSAIAGAAENGTLARSLELGISPMQYCLEASAAVLVRLSVFALVTYWAIRLMNKPLELGLKVRLLGETTTVWLGLGVLVAAVVILAGAYTGRRLWSIAAGVMVAISSYVVDAISRLNPHWHWMADLSPVDWAFGDNPLWKGLDGWGEVSLWLLSFVLVVCAAGLLQWRGMAAGASASVADEGDAA